MKPPLIIDHAIPAQYQDLIAQTTLSQQFPWYTVHEKSSFNTKFNLCFSHLALNDGPDATPGSTASNFYNMLLPVNYIMADHLNKKILKILRIRVGLLTPMNSVSLPEKDVNFSLSGDEPHVDFKIPHYTGLYYVNDSDGDTIIYNETVESDTYTELACSSPKKGRICIFDGSHYHAATKPKESYSRIVITYNFTAE